MKKHWIAFALSACWRMAVADETTAADEVMAPDKATTPDKTSAGEAAAPAAPQSARNGLGLRFGTSGFTVDYIYALNRFVDLRGGYAFGSYHYDTREEDVDYRATLKMNAALGMVDVTPFGGGFRISLGAYSRMPAAKLHADGLDDYELNDVTYRGDLTLDGGVDLGKLAPYAGIGWGGTGNGRGFGMSFDFGVMFGKSPKATLDVTGRACDASAGDCDPDGPSGFDVNGDSLEAQQFQSDKNAEVRQLEDDAKDFRFWPVLTLGLHYRF